MSCLPCSSSDQTPPVVTTRPSNTTIACLVIAAIGCVIASSGLAAYGGIQGWWPAATLSHLGQIPALAILCGGGSTTLICLAILLVRRCWPHEVIRPESYIQDVENCPDSLAVEEEISKGLQDWVTQSSDSGEKRDICASRILKCYRDKSTTLDLSKLNLSSLPPQIYLLSNLEKLDVSSNELNPLSLQIGALKNLKELNLNCNQFYSLPSQILALSSLEKLDVSSTHLSFLPARMDLLNNLKELNLSRLALTSIPPQIFTLRNLERLNLARNKLSSLPPEIGSLSHLVQLDLSQNGLSSLPSEIGLLSHLEQLDLSVNELSSFHPQIASLNSLKQLDLSSNRLPFLPAEIGALSQLGRLNLGNNQLSSLPVEIISLSRLERLDLGNNQLSSLPAKIESLSSLKQLNLSNNRLPFLPAEIRSLSHLKELDLMHNQLVTLPPEIGSLSSLKKLMLTRNRLSSLPAEIGSLSSLNCLSLTGNQLPTLPPKVGLLQNLKEIDIASNRLTSFPREICRLTQLTSLDIRNTGLSSLPEEVIYLPGTLQIRAEANPFAPRVIQHLQELMNTPNRRCAQITFSVHEDEEESTATLGSLLKDLAQANGQPLLTLHHLPSEKVRSWLARLSAIGDYKNKHKEFAAIIYNSIALAEKDAEFRDTFLSCIDEAAETCGDRMALSVLRLEINYKIAQCAKTGDLKQLAYLLGHGSWALSLLESAAENKIRTLRLVDPIEVYLAYPVNLKKALNLPIILDSMLYFGCSGVTEEDLKTTEPYVRECLSSPEAYYGFLAKDATWQKALKQFRTEEYTSIVTKRDKAMETGKAPPEKIGEQYNEDLFNLTQKVLLEVGNPPFITDAKKKLL